MQTLEIIYKWQDGEEEIHYQRDYPSEEADKLMKEVDDLKGKLTHSRYSYRIVDL